MIKKFKEIINKVVAKPSEKDIQCTVDDNIIDCKDLQEDYDEGEAFKDDAINYYTGVPAPVYLKDDPWFGPAPVRSQKQLDYMEQEIEEKRQDRENNFSVEPSDIHHLMYEIATKNQNTTLDLDPIYSGGSENFQEGPGGWRSGNGMNQFTS